MMAMSGVVPWRGRNATGSRLGGRTVETWIGIALVAISALMIAGIVRVVSNNLKIGG
jgi:hypothetical protein